MAFEHNVAPGRADRRRRHSSMSACANTAARLQLHGVGTGPDRHRRFSGGGYTGDA